MNRFRLRGYGTALRVNFKTSPKLVWNFMELSGIKTYGITWKYSIPFQGGSEGIWWNFQSITFQQMEWHGPLDITY